ncbi:TonB-dependent receptor [Vibrio campbellii]|uniref:TonB-dependent receptor n=1 Tax=Vibrio campbellii TaxID=680 RepID=A0AAE9SKS3_9VIBR|nr:TonB-dependent receptor [Vibrio campbellii]UTZ23926.1 TonB-dependent receptor [Vibrio campbellii]UTZ28194.1 TonB-dependent receptor [Vibrio campbellii]UTZ43717.1 TonB-dependent receptor [Vibrio campbellii]
MKTSSSLFNLSPLQLAVCAAISMPAVAENVEPQNDDIERVVVFGNQFNQYKADEASGAMRSDISLMDTPQSVSVIPAYITDEQIASNLGDILENDSSVTAGGQKWGFQYFKIRGFDLSTSSGYLVNGHQHFSYYLQPTEILERVEVLKGPSSMLYGQSGPGGLINMVTKKPTHENMAKVGFDVNSNGSTRYSLDAGGSLNQNETIRYRAVLSKQDSISAREYKQNGKHNEGDKSVGYLNLEFDVTDDVLLSLSYTKTNDESGIDGGRLDDEGNLIGNRETIWDMPWAKTDKEVTNIGADLTYHINTEWAVKLGYNEQQFDRNYVASQPNQCNKGNCYDDMADGYFIKPFDRYDDWNFQTGYIDLTGHTTALGLEHQLLLGANILDYDYAQTRYTYKDSNGNNFIEVKPGDVIEKPDFYNNSTRSTSDSSYKHFGFYVQDLITINDYWKALAGVRYDEQHKEGYGNNSYAVSPKAGLIFNPTTDSSIYVNYSKSFMPQGSVNNKSDVNDGLNLKPQYGEQYELGAKWALFDESLLLTGAIFDIEVSNIKVTEEIVNDPNFDQITSQSGKQNHRGFELGAQGQVTEQLFLTSSMMYLDAEYKRPATDSLDGKRPADTPEWSANVWSRYDVNDQLALNLGAVYEGKRFADNQNTVSKDGYIRFDSGVSYGMVISETAVELRLNVKNLFDTEYFGGGGKTSTTVADGREFTFGVNATF